MQSARFRGKVTMKITREDRKRCNAVADFERRKTNIREGELMKRKAFVSAMLSNVVWAEHPNIPAILHT